MNEANLIWIDLEMTGLDTVSDTIIEIATLITDAQLTELAVGPVIAIDTPQVTLAAMDEWNTRTHTESGLVRRCLASDVSLAEAERRTLEFLADHVPAGRSEEHTSELQSRGQLVCRLLL